MFNLVRRDGARENSGHFEAIGHSGISTYKIGQVVALVSGKAVLISGTSNTNVPYGIVARDEEATGKEVIVLRITDEMEFEAPVFGTPMTNMVPGMALAISADSGMVIGSSTLAEGKIGAIVADPLGAKASGDKIIVRFKV